jgi:lysophospholipase L1-like esterase
MNKYIRFNLLLISIGLLCVCFTSRNNKITIFSIGDSTMADYNIQELSNTMGGKDYPLRGWMMMMSQYFNTDVTIHNHAVSGRSSKSFRSEGHWKKVIDNVKAQDYVFIQFGHNDEKSDTLRHTDAKTTFRQNLIQYIDEVKQKGAFPILFTSIARRRFDTNGTVVDTHGDYVTVVRELATEMNIPLIDLNKKTASLIQSLGPEESKKLFLNVEPGEYTKLPEGKHDDTHLNAYGATKVAELAAQSIKELNLPITKYLK